MKTLPRIVNAITIKSGRPRNANGTEASRRECTRHARDGLSIGNHGHAEDGGKEISQREVQAHCAQVSRIHLALRAE